MYISWRSRLGAIVSLERLEIWADSRGSPGESGPVEKRIQSISRVALHISNIKI